MMAIFKLGRFPLGSQKCNNNGNAMQCGYLLFKTSKWIMCTLLLIVHAFSPSFILLLFLLPNSDLESSSSGTPFLAVSFFSWLFSVTIPFIPVYKETSTLPFAFFLIHTRTPRLLHFWQWLQPQRQLQRAPTPTAAVLPVLVQRRSQWMCQTLFKSFKYSYLSFITRR